MFLNYFLVIKIHRNININIKLKGHAYGKFTRRKDLQNTVQISARRFEESPFISRIDDSKMIRGVYAGRYHAIYNGEDVLHKYWTLEKKL